jgi:dTDP-4-dehydrorhamnose reductase
MGERILVLGSTGMIGHVIFSELFNSNKYEVFGTTRRSTVDNGFYSEEQKKRIRPNVDADNFDTIMRALASIQPDIVINCIGLIKQMPISNDPLMSITINAQLPHRISMICRTAKARMIQISTDCIFSGLKGEYTEEDNSDAKDLYGKTKYLGEVYYPHCVTIRTSTIGHELKGKLGLLEWFLMQEGTTKGFKKAIFTGFPTNELARIISDYIIPNENLSGLYHVAANPISKFDLLGKIAKSYQKKINIVPEDNFFCDRSLVSKKFNEATGYKPPEWDSLISSMKTHFDKSNYKE